MIRDFGCASLHIAHDSTMKDGRAWLHFGSKGDKHLHISWQLMSSLCLVSIGADASDGDAGVTVAVPPISLHVSLGGLPQRFFELLGLDWNSVKHHEDRSFLTERSIRIAMYDWTLLWSLWMPDGMSRSDDPVWRRGGLNLIDLVFGHAVLHAEKVDEQHVLVPMPERVYKGSVVVERKKWTRPRWPFTRGPSPITVEAICYDLQMEEGEGIPVPGKGENPWDCGDTTVDALSGPGDATAAVVKMVEHATRQRCKYGGDAWRIEGVQA